MSEQQYTPDEFSVRMAWVTTGIGQEENLHAEFDRFVAKVQAEAWDEAVASAYLHEDKYRISIEHDPNPYRQEADQ